MTEQERLAADYAFDKHRAVWDDLVANAKMQWGIDASSTRRKQAIIAADEEVRRLRAENEELRAALRHHAPGLIGFSSGTYRE